MTPYGSDRVRVDGERIVLSSRLPKGWTVRVERTLTSAEFPGTAVLWDEQYFEVIGAEALPQGVRYTLEPWREHHAMRFTARYDAAAEAALAAEWRAARVRERKRKTAGGLALLTGHLPAIVQQRLGDELGVLPARLTALSLLSELALLIAIVGYAVSEYMAQHGVPAWTIPVAAFLFLEMAIRFQVSWMQHRPLGSSIGLVAYILYWLATGCRTETSPFASARGHATPILVEASDDRRRADALLLREPLATLLPATDQRRLRERYGYDYRRLARTVAGVLLTFAVLGVITSLKTGALVSGLAALAIAIEQIARLAAFARGPQPSLLGWLVRPLLRNLL
jgi:hypothetical protein